MIKIFLFCSLIFISTAGIASPLEHIISIKERLRLSLWVEGIKTNPQDKYPPRLKQELPEELERTLRKL